VIIANRSIQRLGARKDVQGSSFDAAIAKANSDVKVVAADDNAMNNDCTMGVTEIPKSLKE
jgi:hypothetical protein